ncbi:MAG: Rrf2 family transcriptional regulator [Spirochaetes bacterium]|nr:Rrf2 family transcriptional regulator [Spirochaetota bacterium]
MRTTTRGLYALKAMIALAGKSSQSQPLALHKLAVEEGISTEFLQQIFYRLRNAGLISAYRGPGGGFFLAKETAAISVLDVLEAAGESFEISPCAVKCSETRKTCSQFPGCEAGSFWSALETRMRDFAQSRSLADLIKTNRPV